MVYDPVERTMSTPYGIARLASANRQSRKGKYEGVFGQVPQPRLVFHTDNLVKTMGIDLKASKKDKLTVWVPEQFVPSGLVMNLKESGEPVRKSRSSYYYLQRQTCMLIYSRNGSSCV